MGFKIVWMILTYFALLFLMLAFTILTFPNAPESGMRLLGTSLAIVAASFTRKLFTGKVNS